MIFLGFDTSNYTTSAAAVIGGEYINLRSLLPVKQGERGLRQSDGVFHHTKNIGEIYDKLDIDFSQVCAVGVSTRPRNVSGSYMPVFLVGEAFGRGVAHSLGVPLYEFSHQDGHIMAGIFSAHADELLNGRFLSVHLSGGTTEILASEFDGGGFVNEIVGGTRDISAGQFVDRTGVYLGMRFPCGRELEALASGTLNLNNARTLNQSKPGTLKLPVSEKDGYVNFSGVETKIKQLIGSAEPQEIAAAVFENIGETLCRAINSAICKTGLERILIVGGVASNSILRERFKSGINGKVFFGSAELSSDNAVGTARLAEASFLKQNRR